MSYCSARIWNKHSHHIQCSKPKIDNMDFCGIHSKVVNKKCDKCNLIHYYKWEICGRIDNPLINPCYGSITKQEKKSKIKSKKKLVIKPRPIPDISIEYTPIELEIKSQKNENITNIVLDNSPNIIHQTQLILDNPITIVDNPNIIVEDKVNKLEKNPNILEKMIDKLLLEKKDVEKKDVEKKKKKIKTNILELIPVEIDDMIYLLDVDNNRIYNVEETQYIGKLIDNEIVYRKNK